MQFSRIHWGRLWRKRGAAARDCQAVVRCLAPMPRSPNAQLAWLSLAMFFGMTLWFSATAANAPIVAEFHLSGAQTAWLTMAVQGGFVLGTLVSALMNLPDIVNTRRLFAVGCVIAAAANAALIRADGVLMLIVLRVATGAAL